MMQSPAVQPQSSGVNAPLKILILGDTGAGKTTLLQQFISLQKEGSGSKPIRNTGVEGVQMLHPTFTIDFFCMTLDYCGVSRPLRLFDTPGDPALRQ